MTARPARTRRILPGSPFNNRPAAVAAAETFSMGDRVSHDRYGLGTVVGTEDDDAAVLVDFGSGARRLELPCAKLFTL